MLSSACTLDNIQDFLNELGLKSHMQQGNNIFFHYIMSSLFSVRPTRHYQSRQKLGTFQKIKIKVSKKFVNILFQFDHNVVSCPNCTKNLERYLKHISKVRKSPKIFFLSSIHSKNWKISTLASKKWSNQNDKSTSLLTKISYFFTK